MLRLLIAAALLVPTAAAAAPPPQFLRAAIQGNICEVTLGRLMQVRGGSASARSFGQLLVHDHSRGLAQAKAIAARLHLQIAATLTPEARRELALLQRLKGRSFDREMRRYMIEDHQKDIALFRAQAHSGDRATSGYAAATIPIMQHHLTVAEALRS